MTRMPLAARPADLSGPEALDAIAAAAVETGAAFLSLHHCLLGNASFAHIEQESTP